MCHFKEDFHINVYHRNRLHDLSLHGWSITDISNYESEFNNILFDYQQEGGNFTVDEQVEKLKKDLYPNDNSIKVIVDCLRIDGPEKLIYPTTNGWSVPTLLKQLKDKLYIEKQMDIGQLTNSKQYAKRNKKQVIAKKSYPIKYRIQKQDRSSYSYNKCYKQVTLF